MVAHLQEIVTKYEERVRSMQNAPRFSYGRRMLRSDGGQNKSFFYYLFTDHAMAPEFVKDIGLLRRTMQYDSCGQDMKWSVRSKLSDGFLWPCQRRVAGSTCNQSASIRHGTWIQLCKLTLLEIILLTYDIVCREPAHKIEKEYGFSDHTVADWGIFCRETMFVILEDCPIKISGPNKTIEIDESKFGRRKYHRGHPVKW
jgi:hypothetical protein